MFKGQTCLILLWSNAARAILCVSESPLVLLVDVRSTRTVIRLVKNTRSFATRGIKNGTIDKLFEWFAVTADLIIEQRRSIPFPRSVPKFILICNSYKLSKSLPSEPVLTTTCFIFSKVSILSAEFGFFNAVEMSSLRLTVIRRAGPVCGGVFGFVLDRIRVRCVLELTLLDEIDLNKVKLPIFQHQVLYNAIKSTCEQNLV